MKRGIIIFFIGVLFSVGCDTPQKKYTFAVTNAKIWTGDENNPWAETLISVEDTIAFIGSNRELSKFLSQTEKVVDAQGKLVLPGFIDSHVHTLMGGMRLSSVKLKHIKTKEEFINTIREYAKRQKPGEWILGGDWDHQNWGGELPTHEWIDSVTKQNPVWIERSEGHSGLANTLAMKIAKIHKKTTDIPGGIIERDMQGNPTGIFKDDAMFLIFQVIEDFSDVRKEEILNNAMDYFLSEGITSAHHMIEPHERNPSGISTDYEVFRKMNEAQKLRVRFYIAEPFTDFQKVYERIQKEGRGNTWLKTGALKGYVDGAIGSHSALFFEDYTDRPGYRGIQVNSEKILYERIQKADSLDLQLCIHAIGDKGISIALNTFAEVEKQNGSKDRRFRIEHAQHIRPEDVAFMKHLNVIASMQPYHSIDDGIWCESYIGKKRAETSYASRVLIDSGVHVAFGSDWFVAPASPLKTIYAAVTRRTLDGKNPDGWIPSQKINVEQAVKNITIESAYASFDENIKGSLIPGKLADLVILDKNIFEINPIDIENTKVEMTVVGGKIAYKK